MVHVSSYPFYQHIKAYSWTLFTIFCLYIHLLSNLSRFCYAEALLPRDKQINNQNDIKPPLDSNEIKNIVLPKANDAAFATIFYDYGRDSDALFLATRVLLRSIKNSKTIYRKIIITPPDGISTSNLRILHHDDPSIEIRTSTIPNVFLSHRMTDNHGQLLHMRNKLILWDDPILSQFNRIVYLDPENLVLRNLDEIFGCTELCAVDNGQSIVYSNSLLVVTPNSLPARSVLSDAIDAFMISGRRYNYIGISQGFVPKLFEALEEAPLYHMGQEGEQNENPIGIKSVVQRLPFLYSINHMVFYERLNWDLYQCKVKDGTNVIPGPLLSYKYSGDTVKPWFWLPYVYFQVFWYWHSVRLELNEPHGWVFCLQILRFTFTFILLWYAASYVYVVLSRKSNITFSQNGHSHRRRRSSSSFGASQNGNVYSPQRPHHAPSWQLPYFHTYASSATSSVTSLSGFFCEYFSYFTWYLLIFISLTPTISSLFLALCCLWLSITVIPPLMNPSFAALLWVYVHFLLVTTVILVFHITSYIHEIQHTHTPVSTSHNVESCEPEKKKQEHQLTRRNSSSSVLLTLQSSVSSPRNSTQVPTPLPSIRQLVEYNLKACLYHGRILLLLSSILQWIFLVVVGQIDWIQNPVGRPAVLVFLLLLVEITQAKLIFRAIQRWKRVAP